LTEIKLNCKNIGSWFKGNTSIESITIGDSVKNIGNYAFSGCENITTLICHATIPPVCGTQALYDIDKWNCTLKIPTGTLSAYQAADQWKDFFFIEDIPSAISDLIHDNTNGKDVPVYNLRGVRMQNTDNLPAGVYIKNGKKYWVK
jgi:hypothetical protein